MIFDEIQVLRAMAILAVVLIHVTANFVNGGGLTYTTGAALVLDSAAHFAVPLFICISGFVLTLKTYSLKTFFLKRVSILPTYIVFSIIYAIYFNRPIVASVLNADGGYHLGFFATICGLYLFYPAIMRLYIGWPTLLASLIIELFFWQVPYASMLPIWLYSPLGGIFHFVLGIYACKNNDRIRMILLERTPIILLIFPAMTLWGMTASSWLNRYYGVGLVMSHPLIEPTLYLLIFLILYKTSLHPIFGVLGKMGHYSFGIYLIHVLILEETIRMLGMSRADPLFYILGFIITVCISYIAIGIWKSLCGGLRHSPSK
jgi:surface polysaccharide O-acyltransferase-like enzyme